MSQLFVCRQLPVLLSLVVSFCCAASIASPVTDSIAKGNAFLKNGDSEQATKLFDAAIKAAPKSAQAYLGRARSFVAGPKVIADCNRALSLDPKLGNAYAVRAAAYFDAGQYQKSLDDYNKVILLNPSDLNLIDETTANQHILRADALTALGRHKEAIADCTTALNMSSEKSLDRDWALQNRAQAYEKANLYKEAMADCDAIVKLGRASSSLYTTRAHVNLKFKHYNEAVTDYSEAIKREPADGAMYAWRSKAYEGLGKKELAEKDRIAAEKLGFKENQDYFAKN